MIKTHLIYFSPTGTTKTIIKEIATGLGTPDVKHYDLTKINDSLTLNIDDGLAVFGVPVYAGRVPEIFLKRIENLSGNGIPAVLVVMYGNRAYEDALIELRDVVTEKGFNVIAAGAFIGEHSFSTEKFPIAADRPDSKDIEKARKFGADIAVRQKSEHSKTKVTIPGNTPYKERTPLGGICPETKPDLCTLCKACENVCPASIIAVKSEVTTMAENCIICCACVKVCSSNARVLIHPMIETRQNMLVKNCSERKEPSYFL